jgi:hypothetical protein
METTQSEPREGAAAKQHKRIEALSSFKEFLHDYCRARIAWPGRSRDKRPIAPELTAFPLSDFRSCP